MNNVKHHNIPKTYLSSIKKEVHSLIPAENLALGDCINFPGEQKISNIWYCHSACKMYNSFTIVVIAFVNVKKVNIIPSVISKKEAIYLFCYGKTLSANRISSMHFFSVQIFTMAIIIWVSSVQCYCNLVRNYFLLQFVGLRFCV